MRIAVWGGGDIGRCLAYRLATVSFTSELYWINRTIENIESRTLDIRHGLPFARNCRTVVAVEQEGAAGYLARAELLFITQGERVPRGGTRADVYRINRDGLREVAIPALRQFKGIVVVITNPLDLMTRLIQRETTIAADRVMGLGTVVETARLRYSLAKNFLAERASREIWAYAVGTHDDKFVPVIMPGFAMGSIIDTKREKKLIKRSLHEVKHGAEEVKADNRSTLHPIIEGAIRVAEAVALDRHARLTVSVLDEHTPEGLYYSIPCTVGREGVVERHLDLLQETEVQEGLAQCCESLRETLRQAGDL